MKKIEMDNSCMTVQRNDGFGISAFFRQRKKDTIRSVPIHILRQREKGTIRFAPLLLTVLLLFCTNCHASEKAEIVMVNRILDIVTYSSIQGVKAVYKLLEEQLTFSKDSRTIQLLEQLENFGGGVTDISVWKVGSFLPEKKGFVIKLPIGQHSYTSELPATPYKMLECPGSHVSNGKKVWSISLSFLVTEEWSCGSLGCSYIFGFFENSDESEITSKLCDTIRSVPIHILSFLKGIQHEKESQSDNEGSFAVSSPATMHIYQSACGEF